MLGTSSISREADVIKRTFRPFFSSSGREAKRTHSAEREVDSKGVLKDTTRAVNDTPNPDFWNARVFQLVMGDWRKQVHHPMVYR